MTEPSGAQDRAENRRQFIKKLIYTAPVMETFLLRDPAHGQDQQGQDQQGQDQQDQRKKKSPKPKPKKANDEG